MDIFRTAESLYEDRRQSYGDGDYAWDKAIEEAREIDRRQKEDEERQKDRRDRK